MCLGEDEHMSPFASLSQSSVACQSILFLYAAIIMHWEISFIYSFQRRNVQEGKKRNHDGDDDDDVCDVFFLVVGFDLPLRLARSFVPGRERERMSRQDVTN